MIDKEFANFDEEKEMEEEIRDTVKIWIKTLEILYEELQKSNLPDEIKKQIQSLNLKNSYIQIYTYQKNPTPLDIDKIHSELYMEPKDAYFTQNPYAIFPS